MNHEILCDLCDKPAEYWLCQEDFDDFKNPEVFSTNDGEYPDEDRMVLWDDGDTYIGGYIKDGDYWFVDDDAYKIVTTEQVDGILWCYMPNLRSLYKFQTEVKGRE